MMAENVEKSIALNVAKTFMPETEFVVLETTDFVNFYIFSSENSFVIVSADDRATPILAYSNEFPFVVEEMPDNITYWLTSLNDEIQYAVDNDVVASEEIRSDWDDLKKGVRPSQENRSSVEPLIATHWDQSAPYNNMCPGGSVTGCAATAMAQVMKYWEWPRQGEGSHSYYENNYGTLSVNFGNTTYDWDNMVDMPTTSSPQVQQDAVATLMYHCGVSIDMDYSPQSSGAYPSDVVDALIQYFDYSFGIQGTFKNYYSNSEWKNLLKSELNAGRPILYSGWDIYGGGHSFVCDGYDNSDYFHFNWGWGASCDGYYAIGALNPGQGGTGSGSGYYNENNYILVGVEPNTPSINPPNNVTASADGQTVTVSWSSVSSAHHYKVYRDGFVIDDNVSGTSFTEEDMPFGVYNYYVKSVKSNGDYSLMSDVASVEVLYSGPIPTNLTATQSGANNVQLNWTAPANENAVLKYGDGQHSGYAYGSAVGDDYYWGEKFTSEQLIDYAGMAITSVQTFLYYSAPYTLYIYKVEDGQLEQQVAKTFNYSGGGTWHTVNLDDPLVIDYNNDIIIALHNDTEDYPALYMDNYNGSANASLSSTDGVFYSPIGENISWLFRTNISDGTYTYNVYRDGSQVASNVSQTNYTDQNLSYGTYEYTVRTNYYGGLSAPSEPASVTVTEPESYTVSLSVNPNDAGTAQGEGTYVEGTSVTVSATANTGYIFDKWTENGSQVSSNANYTFTITSDRNLVANFVDSDLSLDATDIEDPSCNGGSDGSITVDADGGTPPYTYTLGGQTSNAINASYTFNNLSAGTYTIEVEDASDYSTSITVELDEPDGMTAGEIETGEEEFCDGETASEISSVENATSDQGGLTYRWKKNGEVISNSNSAQYTPSSLSAGTYIFTREVMDNCEDWTESEGEWTVIVNEIPEVLIEGDNIIIFGESTTLTASGADTYLWNTGETTASITVNPEEETTYSVVGTTDSGCSNEASITVYVEPDALGENDSNSVLIYPNPTKDVVNIVCDNMKNITLYSMTGQLVGYKDVNDNSTTLNMLDYPQSVYILMILKNDGTTIRKNIVYNK